MEQMPDYDGRVALLDETKDRLETLVAPQFMEVLDSTANCSREIVEQSAVMPRNFVSMFNAIGRGGAAMRYFTSWLSVSYRPRFVIRSISVINISLDY